MKAARTLELLPPSPERVLLSPVSAQFKALSFEQWVEAGRQLCIYAGCSQWWIGDWINYAEREFLGEDEDGKKGKKKYGIKYRTALEACGLEIETLRQFAWVARAVKACTRVYELPWSLHREVAKLTPEDQGKFLAHALKHHWSTSELRRAIRRANKAVVDEPALGIGFVPGKWANELRRGLQGAIDRMGPIDAWSAAVRQAWKRDIKIAVDVYNQL